MSWYGKSKFKASQYLKKISKAYNLPYIILRPYQVYGPKQKKDRLIPQTIETCLKNKIFLCTPGTQKKRFLYVDDFVFLIQKILLKKNIRYEIFNVGSGKPILVKNIIKKIRNLTKSGEPKFGAINMRKDEVMNLYPLQKSKKIL